MLEEITFKNFGHDCMYFNFTDDGSYLGSKVKTLEEKVKIRVLIPDDNLDNNVVDNNFTIMLNEKYLNGINPKKRDIIYLNQKLYEIRSVSENNNGTYKTTIERYREHKK